MNKWMDKPMNEWTKELVNKWMNRQMIDKLIDKWIHAVKCMNNEWTNIWMGNK